MPGPCTDPRGLTSILSPCWKGKSAFLSSSPHVPSSFELHTIVLTSPWQSKRGLKCSMRVLLSFPTFTANLGRPRQCQGDAPATPCQRAEPSRSSITPGKGRSLLGCSPPSSHLPPPHSPFGIRQDLAFDLDALSRLDIQLRNNQSLWGQAAGVSPSESKPSSPAWAEARARPGRPKGICSSVLGQRRSQPGHLHQVSSRHWHRFASSYAAVITLHPSLGVSPAYRGYQKVCTLDSELRAGREGAVEPLLAAAHRSRTPPGKLSWGRPGPVPILRARLFSPPASHLPSRV